MFCRDLQNEVASIITGRFVVLTLQQPPVSAETLLRSKETKLHYHPVTKTAIIKSQYYYAIFMVESGLVSV